MNLIYCLYAMYRTFDLDRIKLLNTSNWNSNIVENVTTHLEHTDELQRYGYNKTNLSNAEKTIYYNTTYNSIYELMQSIRADQLHERLPEIDEMIRKINVEFHNSKYLDNSVDQIEQVMIYTAKKLMILINSYIIVQPRTIINTEVNELLIATRNKISVQCGIIVYGMLEPIESIDDDSDYDSEMAVIREERDNAIAELVSLRADYNRIKSTIRSALDY